MPKKLISKFGSVFSTSRRKILSFSSCLTLILGFLTPLFLAPISHGATTGAPSAPVSVTATAGSESITMTWSTPASGSTPTITGYRIEYSTLGTAGSWTTASSSISSSATSYTITGLSRSTAYYTRIAATYASGLGAYGYPWTKVYETSTPYRSGTGTISYSTDNSASLGVSSTNFTRVRYEMSKTVSGVANTVYADFYKTLTNSLTGCGVTTCTPTNLNTIGNLQVPSTAAGTDITIGGDVSDLTVYSDDSAVTNGYGFTGRVELWGWDYDTPLPSGYSAPSGTTAGDGSIYDQADTPKGSAAYGSFQLHNVTSSNTQTIFAWNHHSLSSTYEVGFGSYNRAISLVGSDWTFCRQNNVCTTPSAWNLGIYANIPVTTPSSSITIITTNFGAGTASNFGVSLTGFDESKNYQVTVKFVNTSTNSDVTNGTLTATQGSTTLIAGYSSYSAAKLGFKGSYSAILAALSSLTWNPSSASGDISLRIGIATQPGTNEFYDANSGHYYKYVSTGTSWTAARTAAEGQTLYGLKGYLAEITSSAENSFVGNETSASNIWIGATEDSATSSNFTGSSFTGAAGQKWIWQGAVQTPLPIGSGGSAGNTGNSVSGVFSNWASGEPNNDSKPGQDCAVTNWSGSKGSWNDLQCSYSTGYLIEFGGRPGETSTATTNTLTATVVAQVLTAPSAPTINSLTGADKSLIVAFTAGATGGAAITDYEYSIDGGAYVSAGTTSSPFTITGLQGRTSYSITLKARNSVGLGSASSPLSGTTTDAALDASEAAAAAEAARRAAEAAAAREARREAAAEAARREAANQELASRLSIVPAGGTTNQSGQSFTVNGSTSFTASISPEIKNNYPNISEIKVSGSTVEVVTVDSFSGKLTVPVTFSENGASTTINFELVVNPKPVEAPRAIPVSKNLSNIKWNKSPNAVEYVIKINGEEICRTAQSSCSLPRIIGPKTKITVTALGNDGTASESKLPVFVSEKPIPVTSLKVAGLNSSLTQSEIQKLKEIVDLVRKEGFTKVAVSVPGPSGIADSERKNFNNKSRDVAKYLLKYVKLELDPIEAKLSSTTSGKTKTSLIAGVRVSVIYRP